MSLLLDLEKYLGYKAQLTISASARTISTQVLPFFFMTISLYLYSLTFYSFLHLILIKLTFLALHCFLSFLLYPGKKERRGVRERRSNFHEQSGIPRWKNPRRGGARGRGEGGEGRKGRMGGGIFGGVDKEIWVICGGGGV